MKKIVEENQRSAMKIFLEQMNKQIEDVVIEMRRNLSNSSCRCQKKYFRICRFLDEFKKLETVLIIDVHTRDQVEILIRDGIRDVFDLFVIVH